MNGGNGDEISENLRHQAADWFARLRAPDGDVDREAYRAWRAADRRHADAYDRLAMRWEQSAFLTNTTLGRGRDLDRIRDGARRTKIAIAASGAALLLVAVGGYGIYQGGIASRPPATPQIVTIASRIGEIKTVSLADGSRITLDTGSSVRASLSASGRTAWLDVGRARFDVTNNSAGPFTVFAHGVRTAANATIFDVAIGRRGVTIGLLRGSAEISPPGRAIAGSARKFLQPGQEISVPPSGTITAPVEIAHGRLQWIGGMLAFDKTPLADAVAQMNRYNQRQIALSNSAVGQLQLSGAFHGSDADGFVRAIVATFHLQATSDANGNILLSSGNTDGR